MTALTLVSGTVTYDLAGCNRAGFPPYFQPITATIEVHAAPDRRQLAHVRVDGLFDESPPELGPVGVVEWPLSDPAMPPVLRRITRALLYPPPSLW